MIRHLKHSEINKPLWDMCLAQCNAGHVYACSWYLDIVSPNWEALVLSDYEAIMPLPIQHKWGLKYVYIPPFTQQMGIFSIYNNENELLESFLKAIPTSICHYDLFLNTATILDTSKVLAQRTNQILNLRKPYEDLYKAYSDNVKRNLKKANSFQITENVSATSIVSMFAAEKVSQISSIKKLDLALLENIIATSIAQNQGYCVGIVNDKQELFASACFITFGKRIYYIKGSSTEEGKQQGAMHLLFDYVIKKESNKNNILDFSGSVIPGLQRFYKSFGAEDEYYQHIQHYNLPKALTWLVKKLK